MLVICTAYGSTDEGPSAAAVSVSLTPEFMQSLHRRRRVAQDLSDTARVTGLDSLLFHEASPQWLSWSEELGQMMQAAEATGWTTAEEGYVPLANPDGDGDGAHPVRTDCGLLQVWPERFRFICCLHNTDSRIVSAMLYFDDFFTAAAQKTPAAQRRHAA